MPASVLHRYSEKFSQQELQPASLRERISAQIIDGILLGIFYSLLLYLVSGGRAWSLWISPVFPLYFLQGTVLLVPDPSLWFWGGYGMMIHLPGLAPAYLAYPTPFWILIYAVYYVEFQVRFGQTPGKMLRGLVLLDGEGKVPARKAALLHWIGAVAALLPLGYGFWGRGAVWPDRWSGTRVYRLFS